MAADNTKVQRSTERPAIAEQQVRAAAPFQQIVPGFGGHDRASRKQAADQDIVATAAGDGVVSVSAQELNAKAEKLLLKLSSRFLVACGGVERNKPVEPTSMRTNMTYDPGPPPHE